MEKTLTRLGLIMYEYLEHFPNKGKWIIALKIGAPNYGR
jgi:hypothetical protein